MTFVDTRGLSDTLKVDDVINEQPIIGITDFRKDMFDVMIVKWF